MPKKLSSERIKKMQEARIEKMQNSQGLVWNLGGGIEVHADRYQFILKFPGDPDRYFHFDHLDLLIEYLFYKRAVNSMIKDERKNAEGVLCALEEAKEWLKKVVTPALSPSVESKITRKSLG